MKKIDGDAMLARILRLKNVGGVDPAYYDIVKEAVDTQPEIDMTEEITTWEYYTNDEGWPRWRCRNCGKIVRRNPHDKKYCSACGKRIKMSS